MQVPFHDLRARELGELSCLCPTLVFTKVYAVLQFFFNFFFFQIQKHSSEQLCMHLGLEKLKATKCRGSSSVNVALETDISQSAAQKSFYSLSQYFSDP